MRLPLSWLREWVDWPRAWDAGELARRLTLAGFEIEAIEAAAAPFSGVRVARIDSVEPHPQTGKLRVCRVSTDPRGAPGATLQIVCGAANARGGLVSALAAVGARLPEGLQIGAATKRGVESAGMLCSARELGLAEAAEPSEGILELPPDAPIGTDLREYLDLDDAVFEINVTPNRGDAMSILGMAREVAALSGAPLKAADSVAGGVPAALDEGFDPQVRIGVSVQPGAGAGRFLAVALRAVDNTRTSPRWLTERLRRAGLRSISPIVDVTNYVMLELGQPMHAYDLTKLHGGLAARRARAGERVQLLDGRELALGEDVLVIADEQSAVGLAGVMGGARTGIERASRDIVLEVAWFAPAAIAGRARRYGLTTDASQRFERGVDWRGQERALQRAVRLIRDICGGVAGPIVTAESAPDLPGAPSVPLRAERLQRLLGMPVASGEIERRLRALGMTVQAERAGGWQVQPPSWRFDISIEPDLIEEVARLGGYEAIKEADALQPSIPQASPARQIEEPVVLQAVAARGYQEIITYAFVDPTLQRALFGDADEIELVNPIASNLAVMRRSLWPGLIQAARENLNRQQERIRLFEIGTRFLKEAGGYREQKMIGGLALGARLPEQWGSAATPVDFHDVKGDVESLLALAGAAEECAYEPAKLACLHPGRSARVLRAGQSIGVVGELHPGLVRSLELTYAPVLFELEFAAAFQADLPRFREISRFPRIRRDISITLPERIAFASVRERVTVTASSLLKELRVFDVYHGGAVESGRKSLALGLILQDLSRTLTDEDADRIVARVLDDLRATLDARIRE